MSKLQAQVFIGSALIAGTVTAAIYDAIGTAVFLGIILVLVLNDGD